MNNQTSFIDRIIFILVLMLGAFILLWAQQDYSYDASHLKTEHYLELLSRSALTEKEFNEYLSKAKSNHEFRRVKTVLEHVPQYPFLTTRFDYQKEIRAINQEATNWFESIVQQKPVGRDFASIELYELE